jgi:hypothetical protein
MVSIIIYCNQKNKNPVLMGNARWNVSYHEVSNVVPVDVMFDLIFTCMCGLIRKCWKYT